MPVYYNEIDPFASAWLRNLIKEGLIPDGEVDTRSIADVSATDLRGFSQCHFFAGIGGWSHALALAGWPDDRPIWTGSCPCQPFSVAGKGKGKADERHLWPVFHQLIAQCRPPVVMGEQVAGKSGYDWFDGVAADLEAEGYASRAVDIPACSVNAPHIRQRLYWCAVGNPDRSERQTRNILAVRAETRPECSAQSGLQHGAVEKPECEREGRRGIFRPSEGVSQIEIRTSNKFGGRSADNGDMVNTDGSGQREHGGAVAVPSQQPSAQCAGGDVLNMADANSGGCTGRQESQERRQEQGAAAERVGGCDMADAESSGWRQGFQNPRGLPERNGAQGEAGRFTKHSHSFWDATEWLTGADGKTRRAKPGVRLLAHGLPNRVGLLRGFGNAIVPPLAAEVIKAFMETEKQNA